MNSEVEFEKDPMLDEEIGGASAARQRIVDMINNLDAANFDITPWTKPNTIRPLPKQEEMILSTAQVTFFGGSAGSGKSDGIVLDPLQHKNDPNFEAITFRRTTKSLKGAGGIFQKAGKVYNKLGAKQNLSELKYTFPSGSTARYSHMEHGVNTAEQDHAGLEYSAIN